MNRASIFTAFLLLLTCINPHASAQECDTIIESKDTADMYFFYHHIDSLALGKLNDYDMKLAGIQNYDQIFKTTPFFASLGNPGLLYKDLVFNPFNTSGFNFGINSFDAYLFTNRNTSYFQLHDPFSELIYVLGPKKEQMIQARFDTRVSKNITLGADFRYIFAPGRYQRQKSDNKSLAITGQYFTKNRRYGIIGNYRYNKIFVYENGGITTDSIFEQNLETDRFVIPVNLGAAENQVRQISFFFNQYFNLQKKHKKINDSTYLKRKFHAGRISHSINWSTETQKYIDNNPMSGFYGHVYLDSTKTFDSVYHFNISNKLMWSNLGYIDSTEKKPFYIHGAARHEYHELGGYGERRYFNQIIPSAGIQWMIRNSFFLDARGEFVIGDYNGGDYSWSSTFSWYPGKTDKKYGQLEIGYSSAKQKPGWFYQQYSSNHFKWENNFSSVDLNLLSLYYKRSRLKAGIEYVSMNNYVALDSMAIPHQAEQEINLIKAIVFKDFRISIVGIDIKAIYQKASDDTFIAIPEIMGDVAIFVTIPLFKGATTIQPGFRVFYNTKYTADAYMPALRSFYRQKDKEIGDFVYADFFFNFRIKRARMFLKYSHFNSLFGSYDYYMVPSYPMMDAGFRFGISWKFFD
jgi:hypothetical protein